METGSPLSPHEAHGLWRSLRENPASIVQEQRRLLAQLLSESSLAAIVEDAKDRKTNSNWLPKHIRSEMRTALSELSASESMQLAMQCPTVSACYTTTDMLEVLDQDGLDDVRQLLSKAATGGRQLWDWLQQEAEEEEIFGFFHESLLTLAILSLQRRINRLEGHLRSWGHSQIQEGLRHQLNHSSEVLIWCKARRDMVLEDSSPRVRFGHDSWKESMKETAFSRRAKFPTIGERASTPTGSPRQRQEALHRRLTKLEEKAKDPELRILAKLRDDAQPVVRFDTWAEKPPRASNEWPSTFNARSVDVKKQVRALTSRRRCAEGQAEMARLKPCAKASFTRTRLIYAGASPAAIIRRTGPGPRPKSAVG